jgi:hypothetical protein
VPAPRRAEERPTKKLYSPPQLRELSFEQASLFLTHHASWNGDADARTLLEIMFPLADDEPTKR